MTSDSVSDVMMMRDSGFKWLGSMPSHWELKRFKFLYSESNAGEVIDKSHWHVGEELLFTCQRAPMKSSFPKFKDRIRTRTSDLLLTRNGTPYVHLPPDGAIYSNVVQRVRLKKDLNRRFVWYALSNSCLYLKGFGDIIESFNMSTWDNLVVPIPSLSTQENIVTFLDQKTAEIDAAIAKKQRLIELLKEQKAILINQAVTKGLNPDVPMRDSGVEWIGGVPEHWEVIRLKYLFSEVSGWTKTGEEELLSLRMYAGLVPHNDVSDKPITDTELIGYKLIVPGQMVMNRMRASIGLFGVARSSGLVSPDYAVFDVTADIDVDYYQALFKTTVMGGIFRLNSRGLGTGASGFMRLYTDSFGRIKVPFPPKKEQVEISQQIEKVNQGLGEVESKVLSEIELLNEMKITIISSVVTGKIKI